MFRIALCDDNRPFLNYEKELIECFSYENSVDLQCDTYLSGDELISRQENIKRYALFILDYDMNGLTGFETARKIYEIHPNAKIAFATNYYDFTREGYKYNAVRYLVKLEETFKVDLYECIETVIKTNPQKKMLLELAARNEEVDVNDVLYIVSNKHYVEYVISNPICNDYSKRCSLDDLEKKLPECFVRVHQRYIVNMKRVTQVMRYKVTICNESWNREIPIARNRYDEVNKRFCLMKGDF